MVDTRDAFGQIIKTAQHVLRISSPFLQKNIIENESFPELKKLFLEAFDRGCGIRILSREIFLRREPEFEWLINLIENTGYSAHILCDLVAYVFFHSYLSPIIQVFHCAKYSIFHIGYTIKVFHLVN